MTIVGGAQPVAVSARETPDAVGVYAPGRSIDLALTLFPLRRGHGDPTLQWSSDGAAWRTQRTPQGPATMRMLAHRSTALNGRPADEVELEAWGAGAAWSVAHAAEVLGEGDDWSGLDLLLSSAGVGSTSLESTALARLTSARRRNSGMRLARTGIVLDSAMAAVLEQKVTGVEARRAWRTLIRQHGSPAPGPVPALGREVMRVVPDAEQWRSIPDHDWHRAGVGPQRMRTARRVAAVMPALERTLDHGRGGPAVAAALQSVPGVGIWTAAEITQRAHGDPDAVSVGDFHLSGLVGHALTGERTDDAGMLALLAPFAGHRQRIVRLIMLLGYQAPRRGPRLTIQDHRAH
jgi:3-methyladenine DNA glycosylase/8-oxoguanine DNA glycosylase